MDHAHEDAATAPAPSEDRDARAGAAEPGLEAAARQLRDDAERLAKMPLDENLVAAAERVAEAAVQLDEQIGAAARKDDR